MIFCVCPHYLSQAKGRDVPREFALREAPARVFDVHEWKEFKSHFDTDEIAIERLSRLIGFPHEFFRRGDSKKPDTEEARRQSEEHLYALSKSLFSALKNHAACRKIVATGVQIGFNQDFRAEVDANLWAKAWPDFWNNELRGYDFRYIDVLLRINDPPPIDRDYLHKCLVDWLRSLTAGSDEPKNSLASKAFKTFEGLTTRGFNAAYTEVFAKTRGRPRKK